MLLALAAEQIASVWEHFSADQVYRADSLGVIRSGAQWLTMLSVGWLIARWRKARPRSLLDNEPLAELLKRLVPLEQDGLVEVSPERIVATDRGRLLLRIVAACFDRYLHRDEAVEVVRFSRVI